MEDNNIVNQKLFGFTYKDTKSIECNLNEASYENILKMLRKHGNIIDLVYENKNKLGGKARLHIHGVIDFLSIPRLTTLIPVGYSVKFDKIYNLNQFQRYIHKND